MAETAAVIPPPQVAGTGNDIADNSFVKATKVNEMLIVSVMERMRNQLQDFATFDSLEFIDLCIFLARGIDFCVANQQIPQEAQKLPLLLKQMCQPKHDASLLAAIMVLLISVKSAIQSNWFPEKDAEELYRFMNEIGKHFSSSVDFSIEPSSSHPIISTIMSRFYPRMKMGQILFVLEAKPGFGAYVKDFGISKQLRYSSVESVKLLVARTDNAEASTCLVTPPQVNFLLNGKGVEKRANVSTEVGPQMPTNVTAMLKYGTNLLQGIGNFNGSYIIVMALVSETSTLSNLEIEDYVQPAATLVDPDSDLIEGPSRISLNCPISFKRIKTPVKGHSCRHHQCFDFDNYLGINSKKPTWRCPICNSNVCFTDIRIDQNMVKVLSDIGENVNDVIISSDGSWKAIMIGDDHLERLREKFSGEDLEMPDLDSRGILDLTGLDDEMDSIKNIDSDDRKAAHIEDDFWSGMYRSTFPSQTPNDVSDSRDGITPDPSPASVVLPPVSNAVIDLTPSWEAVASTGNALVPIPGSQKELSSPTGWQLQQYHPYADVAPRNEFGRSLPMHQHITRTPNAVQALPAQPSNPGSYRPRNGGTTCVEHVSLTVPRSNAAPFTGDGYTASPGSKERMSPFSGSHVNSQFSRSHASSQMVASSSQPHLNAHYNRPRYPVPQSQQYTGSRVPNQRPPGGQFQYVAPPMLNYSRPQGLQGGPPGVSSPGGQFQSVAQAMPNYPRAQGIPGAPPGISSPRGQFQSTAQPTPNYPRPQGIPGAPPGISSPGGQFQSTAQPMPNYPRTQGIPGAPPGISSPGGQFQSTAQPTPNYPRAQGIPGAPPGISSPGGQFQSTAQPTLNYSRGQGIPGAPPGISSPNVGSAGPQQYRHQAAQVAKAFQTPSTTQFVTEVEAFVDGTGDNWRPNGRMRGSLSGQAYSEALSHYTHPTTQQANIAAPSLPSPATSARLQILMANRAALQEASSPSTGLSNMSSSSGVLPPNQPPRMI